MEGCAVDTVVNCPSYQYFLAYLYVLIASVTKFGVQQGPSGNGCKPSMCSKTGWLAVYSERRCDPRPTPGGPSNQAMYRYTKF